MSLIVFGAARSAPGVTTLALATASWLDRAILVEGDPDGGVLAVRYGLGREPGLVTFTAARAAAPDSLLEHAQRLPGGLPVVVAPETAEKSGRLWRLAGAQLSDALAALENHVAVVDAGRLSPSSPALHLVAKASLVLLVARPSAEELIAADDRLTHLAATGGRVGLVLIGERPYAPGDVATELGCEVFGVIADDRRAAKALAGGGGRRAVLGSALMRSARALAGTIAERLDLPETPVDRAERPSQQQPVAR